MAYFRLGAEGAPAVTSRLRLQPEEEIVASALTSKWWMLSRYIFTLGLWAIWRKRHAYVLTTQRLVLLKGMISKSQQAVQLERVQDVNVVTSPLTGGRIALSTAGGSLSIRAMTYLTQGDAREFADAVQHQMHAVRAAGGSSGL